MSIVTGCACGALGLTSVQGGLFLLFSTIFVNFLILFKMKFDLGKYSANTYNVSGILSFLTADLQKSATSFMLFWTLFYAMFNLY
jgi:hypothetical protein